MALGKKERGANCAKRQINITADEKFFISDDLFVFLG